jgi:hypothetical protein
VRVPKEDATFMCDAHKRSSAQSKIFRRKKVLEFDEVKSNRMSLVRFAEDVVES